MRVLANSHCRPAVATTATTAMMNGKVPTATPPPISKLRVLSPPESSERGSAEKIS